MSQLEEDPHENINVPSAEIGDGHYPPQSAQNQDVSDFVDGSGPIFSMYMEMATEEDKKMVENWKADADGILIFTGLFSAAVASLISVSIQDIRQNPQDISNFYLANTYQATINPNISSSLPTSPPSFSPPNYAVWVNALWFLSLVISLTCALLATLLQQWARRYLKVTQSRYSPHKRARIRSFFAEGVQKCLLPWVVDTLPALLHISLFLFFAGLVVFLSNVNISIFKSVLSWVGLCTTLYGCVTLMPIIRCDSPYHTPLSLLAWNIVAGISYIIIRALRTLLRKLVHLDPFRLWFLERSYRKLLVQGMQKTAEETALILSSDIDIRALMWTFDSLDEDHELERFFSGLPGLRSSKFVGNLLPRLTLDQKRKIDWALFGLLDRTLTSDLLLAPVKTRRAMICANAVDLAHFNPFIVLNRVLSVCQHSGPLATGIVKVLRPWRNNTSEGVVVYAQATIAEIVARMRPRDDSWYILASNELGVPDAVLRDYATQGDSLSLAILIHVIRQHFIHFNIGQWSLQMLNVLEDASKLNAQDTTPELQHNFCVLWNQIIHKVQNGQPMGGLVFYVLRPIRHCYITLHQDTSCAPSQFSASTGDRDCILGDPFAYPLCNIPGHHPDSTAHIHDVADSVTFTRAVLLDHDNNALVLPGPRGPDTTSACIRVPLCFDESLTDAPSLDTNLSVSVPTATEIIPSALPTLVTTRGKHEGIKTLKPMHLPTVLEPSASATPKSKALTSPSDAIVIEHTGVSHTASKDVDVPSSPSQCPVLDKLLRPDSHSPMLAPAARGQSCSCLSSSPKPSSAAEGRDSAKPLRKEEEKGAPYPCSTIHEDIMVTPDVQTQSQSLQAKC